MDRIDAMRVFVAAIDGGSLIGAARRTGRSAAAATRAIAQLEAQAQTILLHRTTRVLRLTEAGEAYAETCRRVLADIDEADRLAAGERVIARGTVTLTAPVAAGSHILRPILDAFLDDHPVVQARLLLLDRRVNLDDEGVDVALRIAHLPDSALVAVRVGTVRRVVCAAPHYLDRHSPIERPQDLADHRAIVLTGAQEGDQWPFVPSGGVTRPTTIAVSPRLTVNSVDVARESAMAGHGVARLLSYQIADAVRCGQLRPLLENHEVAPLPVHLLMPRSRLSAAKVRAFVDFAKPRLHAEFAAQSW